jgi:hypothetical protein
VGYGGYFPYPRRFGGGKPRLRIVHEALNAARGSALDATNKDTVVWVENMAYARALTFDGFGVNEKLSLQSDPYRTTDMLARWEKIYRTNPAPNATPYERRQLIAARVRRFIEAAAMHARLVRRLQVEVGAVFSAVEYISVDNAVIHVDGGSYPFGTVEHGVFWSSTVAHILILLVKPAGYSEADFYNAAAKVGPAIDGLIPAWCTFDWYRRPTSGVAVNVSGGPSQGGFYLDSDANLDNNLFSE